MLIAATCLGTVGCVTETIEPKDRPLGAADRGTERIGQRNAPTLPTGAVARPASTATTVQSAVRVAIQPLGHIDFDRQILPQVAPNGHAIASQVGEAPDWPTMLAEPGASIPRTRITALKINDDGKLMPIVWPSSTNGMLLGRSADTRGVLVESPRADGSRWIGVLPWATGEVDWLITTQQVNAHAIIVGNTLAWCQRDIGEAHWTIRVRDLTTGAEAAIQSNASLAFPLITPDERTVLALAVGEERLRLQSHAIERSSRGIRLGGLKARIDLGIGGEGLIRAYQTMLPAQATPQRSTTTAAANQSSLAGSLVLIYHPGIAAMALIDAERGEFTPLAPQSIAGALNLDEQGQLVGVFLTTPRGLEHQPILAAPRGRRLGDTGPTTRVLSETYVPRLLNHPTLPYLLLGPSPRQPGRLTMVGMSIAPPETTSQR